jgi:diguanylate cyclase (GGDEF)-like protein/putative nucleotidyltransferase with HDIG domain
MTATSLNKKHTLEKGLWALLGTAMATVVMIAIAQLFASSLGTFTALGVAILVSALICRHRFQIPGSKIEVLTKHIIALWGIIWLGPGGGVLLSLAASVFTANSDKYARKRKFLQMSSDTIATATVANIYSLASIYVFNDSYREPQGGADMLAVIFLITAVHFSVLSTLNYVGRRVISDDPVRRLLKDCYGLASLSYIFTFAGILVAHFTFVQFGIEFGLVILPTAMIASMAHVVHHRRLAKKTREISEASRIHLATVEALATAIDARDQVGVGHVRRAQIYAIGIGEFLALSEDEINALRTAALLHDIGKLAVPDHILNRPSVLTLAEIEKMKIHSSVGASILEKVGFNTPVVPTVRYHHENWDGTGYPEALRGENIPLTARILAVADAYDTMRGARPFRPAVSREDARSMLAEDAGKKFDPRVVRVFLDIADRLEAEVTRKGLGYDSNRGDDRLRSITGSQQNFVDQIKLANREAFTLYELAKEFSSSLSLSETASLFSEKIREFVRFDTCTIYLIDEKSGSARSVHVAGKHAAVFNGHQLRPGEGITGGVLESGTAARSLDPWPDLKLLRSSVTSDYRSMVSLPLVTEDRLIGAVSLYSIDPAGYGDEQLRILETISCIASDAIHKSLRHAVTESYALTDSMTGLPNARSLQLQFDREVARARRAAGTFQVLMLDLDGFKKVNDSFGHKIGDKMLIEIGRVIKGQLREYDFLARYAGDEFVALVPDTSVESVYELCTRIEKAVDGFELPVGEDTARVGVSIGWATYPYTAEGFDQLVIAADKGMYSAKSRRKHAMDAVGTIPRPDIPLEFDMPIGINPDDIETVVEVDETHIYSAPMN